MISFFKKEEEKRWVPLTKDVKTECNTKLTRERLNGGSAIIVHIESGALCEVITRFCQSKYVHRIFSNELQPIYSNGQFSQETFIQLLVGETSWGRFS